MFRIALLLATPIVIGTPTVAGYPTGQAQPAGKTDKDGDKIVCRVIATTGSRLAGERVCKRWSLWERDSDTAREDMEQQEKRGTGDAMNGSH